MSNGFYYLVFEILEIKTFDPCCRKLEHDHIKVLCLSNFELNNLNDQITPTSLSNSGAVNFQ